MTGNKLRKSLNRFIKDDSGSITLEFMIWLPLLLFWLTFSLGAFFAMANRSDAARATYTISDVISRYKEGLDRDKIENLNVLLQNLLPNALQGQMRISAISFDGGAYTVEWTECFGNIAALTDDEIPLNVVPTTLEDGNWVILTETYVPYLPITSPLGFGDWLLWQTRVVSRPRFVEKLENTPDMANCGAPDDDPGVGGFDPTLPGPDTS